MHKYSEIIQNNLLEKPSTLPRRIVSVERSSKKKKSMLKYVKEFQSSKNLDFTVREDDFNVLSIIIIYLY